MKKVKAILIILGLGMIFTMGVLAQLPPQPPSDPTAGGNQSPGGPTGAPIDGGAGILLTLAAAYGLKKGQKVRQSGSQEVRR